MGQPIPSAIGISEKWLDDSWNIALEEIHELDSAVKSRDIAGIADGVVDCLYTIPQLTIVCGIDIVPIWDAVHKANMSKADGPVCKKTGKRLKPPGFKHPDIAALLMGQVFPLYEANEFKRIDEEYAE